MRRKTNKAIYAVLGFLAILFALLGVFSFKRRFDFLKEGDAVMAKFCITFGLVLLGLALLSAVFIILLLKRDKKIQFLQDSLFSELGKSPSFKTWFLQEEGQIKKRYGSSRKIGVFFSVLLAVMIVVMLIFILDDIGGALINVSILLAIAGIVFLLRLSDYNRNFLDPMLESVSLILPDPSDKEAFANQIRGKQKCRFIYEKEPGFYSSTAFIMPDYCYFSQFRSSRVIINAQIRKIVLNRVSYTIGRRLHFRSCYAIELYLDSDRLEKPAWRGYFTREEAVYQALSLVQKMGAPNAEIEDRIGRGGLRGR